MLQFIKLALDFIELGISKQFSEYFPQVRDSLRKIHLRTVKLAMKRENPLLNHFTAKTQTSVVCETELDAAVGLPLDQLNDLRFNTSESLYELTCLVSAKL